MSPDKLPVPLPPPPEPPKFLKALLGQRILLVVVVIILFLGLLFGLKMFRKKETPMAVSPGEAPVTAKAPAPAESEAPVPAQPPEAQISRKAEVPKTLALTKTPKTAQEHPSLAPALPPPEAAPKKKLKGEAFTRALIKIMDDQVNKNLFGWRPNSILFGKLGLTDNVNNLQLGVLEVARRTVIVLNENMTRFAVTEAYNPQVNEALNFLMVSPDKYWFPSASGKYREAMEDLAIYIEELGKDRSRFYTRVDNIIVLFSNYKDILGSSFHNLVKDTEADGSPISWFKSDDYFSFSQGVAQGMAEMLEAVKDDFHQELQKKNTHKLLEDAIHALHAASHLHPWIITNGSKDGILANHRANMSTYIGEAEHLVATMQTVLATN